MKKALIFISVIIFFLIFFYVNKVHAVNVSSSLCQEKTTEIGGSYTGTIKLNNNKGREVDVRIYQTDYLHFSDGTNQFGEPGQTHRSNAKWIEPLYQQITIPPKQTSLLNYTVNVPNEASLSGSYWSMIMLEEVSKNDLELISSGSRQMGIRQITRYAVQIVTHIGSSGSHQLEFKNMKLLNEKHKRFLRIDLENSGTRALRPSIWVDVYADNGGFSTKINGRQRRIFPECSVMERLDFSDIPPGDYKAVVVADTGEETVFGTSFSLQLKE